ncbi:MAG: penicillin-binding protein 2 [Candidatus Portnoybacteria bacterium]|nr:penicillin-binding protein 2 [Candidatus Portnoybacteria bacterium]
MELKKYFIKNKAREDIEAEEIFLDAEAIRSLEDKGKLEQPIKRRNFFLFYALIIVCLVGLLLRAGHLEVIKGEYYQNLAQGNRLRIYSLPAPRGIIYDRFQQPLVYNIPSFDLAVNLNDFLDNPPSVQEEILEKISHLLAENDFKQKIEQAQDQVSQLVLAKNIERSAALILESLVKDWPGWRLEKNPRRQYIAASYFAHILGYTGQVSPTDLEEHPDYSLNDQIGKIGLELQYESLLRGQPGQEQIEVDFSGKTQSLLATKPAQSGQGLVLHIDEELQKKVYQGLEKVLNQLGSKKRAAAVAIDPQNGGILALVSLPSFDSNLFAQGISQVDLAALKNDPNLPFLNRALAGQYPSGSTIKPLIAAAALEEEIVKPEQQINCQGGLSIAHQYYPQIIYHYPDWKTHGLTDIVKAIAQSCNVFFYIIGGDLGVEQIKKHLQYFGLGQASQIDLPHEEIGLIPDQEWKKEAKPNEDWYLGDTYHLAIGQGDILVTPLQLTSAIASLVNGNILYQPQLVDKIIDSKKNIVEDIPAKVIRQEFIKLENIEIVQEGMRQAVLTGSARALADLAVKVAGKTGTAQFGTRGETHAWFVGYAPYEEPQIVLTILVEGGGSGDQVAVPVAKEVLEWYFKK